MSEILQFKIGDRVRTKKGCKNNGPSSGVITGFSKWKDYPAANVIKDNGQKRQFLIQNLFKI